jgi:hypothetical protein
VLYRAAESPQCLQARTGHEDENSAAADGRTVVMKIVDDGRRFSLSKGPTAATGNRWVRRGLQERFRFANGQIAINSVPKRGVTVRVQIPLPTPEPVDPFKAPDPPL